MGLTGCVIGFVPYLKDGQGYYMIDHRKHPGRGDNHSSKIKEESAR